MDFVVRGQSVATRIVGLILVVVAIASTVYVHRVTACQTEWNEAFREALLERSRAAELDRGAMRTLLDKLLVVQPNISAEERQRRNRAAIVEYAETLRRADETRAQNPLPASDNCG